MDELSYLTPLFDKDKEYTECENCCGDGQIMTAHLYPGGHTECIETCPECKGEGQIEIEN